MEKYKIWYLACIVIICSSASFGISQEEEIFWSPKLINLNLLKRMDEKLLFAPLVPGIIVDDKIDLINKRGFSMLARWKPFNKMAKQRASIRDVTRNYFAHPEPDMVSAETRAYLRPSGQPLRWG